MKHPSLKTICKIAAALAIAVFASLISANRTDSGKDRNDTTAYANHFNCISSGKSIEQCRNEIGGTKYEFIYEQFINLQVNIFQFDSFYQIKLVTALAIYSIILVAVALHSRAATLSLLILILDFRFWEYGSNVLRHGLAAAFIAVGALLLTLEKPILALSSKLIATLSHLSAAIVIYTPKTKYRWRAITALLTITAGILATPEYWIPAILTSEAFDYKIDHYLRNSDGYLFSLPAHYAAAILTGIFIYSKTTSKRFVITYNHLITLFLAAIILGYLDASYRMTSFMLPLLAVNIPDQIHIISNNFKEKQLAKQILTGATSLGLAAIAYKNWDFFVAHLG